MKYTTMYLISTPILAELNWKCKAMPFSLYIAAEDLLDQVSILIGLHSSVQNRHLSCWEFIPTNQIPHYALLENKE